MKQLCYETLIDNNYKGYINQAKEEKILQIGDGNFLRGFVDYFFDVCCEKGVYDGRIAVVQPVSSGKHDVYSRQNGLYTLYSRGIDSGITVNNSRIISSISRCLDFVNHLDEIYRIAVSDSLEYIVSNTTEAGIVYDKSCSFNDAVPATFPAKLTKLLYKRYSAEKKGVIVLSCELIEKNGEALLDCVIRHSRDWLLGDDFINWLQNENLFCSTLVDRIVPGEIRDKNEAQKLEIENNYTDSLSVAAECFYSWIIEGPEWLEDQLPFKKAALDIRVVPDITPYKTRKVRILNGAHTGTVLGAYMAGFDIVRDCVSDSVISQFVEKMIKEEIVPYIDLDREELLNFADAVIERFLNPYIDHSLLSISINSISKWRTRILPSLKEFYYRHDGNVLPECLSASLAFLLDFYWMDILGKEGRKLLCRRPDGREYYVNDDEYVVNRFYNIRNIEITHMVSEILGDEMLWNCNLLEFKGLKEAVSENLSIIKNNGEMELFRKCMRHI